jgi:hypothetical protein
MDKNEKLLDIISMLEDSISFADWDRVTYVVKELKYFAEETEFDSDDFDDNDFDDDDFSDFDEEDDDDDFDDEDDDY